MECANCYLPNRDYSDVSFEKLKLFINSFKNKVEFRLIGGEPTLHPELDKIIKHISQHTLKHRVILITNGLKLASSKYVKSLTSAGLHYVYLSMNGFNEQEPYEILDNLDCVKNKMMALQNCQNEKMSISIGFIVVKGINDHLILKMKDYFKDYKQIVNFEFRNIGNVGRNMIKDSGVENYTIDEIKEIIFDSFKISDDDLIRKDQYSSLYRGKPFFIHIHNWLELPNKFNESTNQLRGRMTENFLVAPFLDHIVDNEGYY
jgi:molybdenum cofactor biosynthesis enzyme MoaA